MRFAWWMVGVGTIALAAAIGCSSSSTSSGGTGTGTDAGGGGGGGGTIQDAFVGTWTRAGSVTIMCGNQAPMMSTLSGNLVLAAGSAANTLVGTQPDGCMTTYTISGNTASESPNQKCMTTQGTTSNSSHTLTLSGDKKTLAETSQGLILESDPDGGMMSCDLESMGTFTKQ
jgi:hypothetical protein